jgi:hypothetical protein
MKSIGKTMMAAALASAPMQAQAAEWWCVLGSQDAQTIQFVDTDSMIRTHDTVTIAVQRFNRAGTASRSIETVRCDSAAYGPDARALRDFACGTLDHRMNNGVILGDMTPAQATQIVFASRATPHTVQTSSR